MNKQKILVLPYYIMSKVNPDNILITADPAFVNTEDLKAVFVLEKFLHILYKSYIDLII